MKRTISPTSLAMLTMLALSGCVFAPPFYWAESIHGRVVDADTGEPIEEAVVVADWKLYGGGMGHGGHRNSLLVEETLSDTNGEFRFGKWGPKLRPAREEPVYRPWPGDGPAFFNHVRALLARAEGKAR